MNDMINPISSVSIWKDGETKSATQFLLRVIADDLYSQAIFYYELRTASDEIAAAGNLTLSGTDYTDWNTNSDSTSRAFIWAADQLNLTLV